MPSAFAEDVLAPAAKGTAMSRALALLPLLAAATGCLAPHSMAFGTTARPLGPGGAETSVSPGIAYEAQNSAAVTTSGVTTQSSSRVLSLGLAEGNLEYGVAEALGVNVHFSAAGVQPGFKFSFKSGDTDYAVLPSLALGY